MGAPMLRTIARPEQDRQILPCSSFLQVIAESQTYLVRINALVLVRYAGTLGPCPWAMTICRLKLDLSTDFKRSIPETMSKSSRYVMRLV